MKRSFHAPHWIALGVATAGICAGLAAARGGRQNAAQPPLSTGKLLTPQGEQTNVGSYPANLILSPDGKWVVVTDTGAREFLSVLDASTGKRVSQIPVGNGSGRNKAALYVGLAFGPVGADGSLTLYASRGPEDKVAIYSIGTDGKLTDTGHSLDDPSGLPAEAKTARPNFLAGLALSADGRRCYAVHNETSAYTDYKGSVSVIDTVTNHVLGKMTTPAFPYAVAVRAGSAGKGETVYVASERDGVVSVLDATQPSAPALTHDVKVGDHPMALLLDKAQRRLFVANASSDDVSILDTATNRVTRTLALRPANGTHLPGMTPTGLALSPDESRLYVTLADWNAVAVVDLKADAVAGYIPVGWCPTAVVVSADGSRLFVANARGAQTHNPNKPDGTEAKRDTYIENILEGTVSMLPTPAADVLKTDSVQALVNNHFTPNGKMPEDPAQKALAQSGIKHVIYLIKENRTYDQVLGDMPQGNGDASLTLFGRAVTPNLHALAERFGLFDNFYDCAEVSADGWNWSTSGMVSEYTSRNVHFNYSGRGRAYDFEGTNNDVPVDLLGMKDVAEAPGGYIWDQCRKHGRSYRSYGFFSAFADLKDPKGNLMAPANTPVKKSMLGHSDDDFLRFEMTYADSEAWQKYNLAMPGLTKKFGKFDAPSRYSEWKREFDQFVKDGSLPQFEMVRLPCDHTSATRPGSRSPRAMVADNDYGVGQIVEAVSHSPYWKDTAIFVLEDDAQDGQDHVDAHRSIAFIVSSHLAPGAVDHHFYNTDSVLHTMEVLLGLPPMNQYDASAPLFPGFRPTPVNAAPYAAALPAKEIIGEINDENAYRARDSRKLDFSQADRVPDGIMNDILWHSIKGASAPMPAPHHLFPATTHPQSRDED
jgi:YVTN family beta-propeller protein